MTQEAPEQSARDQRPRRRAWSPGEMKDKVRSEFGRFVGGREELTACNTSCFLSPSHPASQAGPLQEPRDPGPRPLQRVLNTASAGSFLKHPLMIPVFGSKPPKLFVAESGGPQL